MKEKDTRFTRTSENIYADLGVESPDEHMLKADIAVFIGKLINRLNLTQTAAALKIGMAQSDVSRILRGQLSGYSLERLLAIVRTLGQDIEIKVRPAKNRETGRIRMSA